MCVCECQRTVLSPFHDLKCLEMSLRLPFLRALSRPRANFFLYLHTRTKKELKREGEEGREGGRGKEREREREREIGREI